MQNIVSYLESRGVNMRRFLKSTPSTLQYSLDKLQEKIAFLEENGLDVAKHLHIAPCILSCSLDQKLRPTLHFVLEDMGRSRAEVDGFPLLWYCSLEKRLQPRFRYLQSLGREDCNLRKMLFSRDEVFCRTVAGHDLAHFLAWQNGHNV
eukprot:EG_transcript_43502